MKKISGLRLILSLKRPWMHWDSVSSKDISVSS